MVAIGPAAHNWGMRKPKRPRDPNQLGKAIVDAATGNAPPEPEDTRDPAAVALGRKGGLKGGKARAAKLTAEQRKAIAKRAVAARWGSKKGDT
jgi:hypothetical protein